MKAIWGKLRGKGARHHECPTCGKRIDLTQDRCWLGDGGWYCDPCGLEARRPVRARRGRARNYHRQDLTRYGRQVLEAEGGMRDDE